jgi:hypothetical protein
VWPPSRPAARCAAYAAPGFSLASVGIKASGRTTILRLNDRNTAEILGFAYRFARQYLDVRDADNDGVPLVEPIRPGATDRHPSYES